MRSWEAEAARVAWCRRVFGDDFEVAFGGARADDINESRFFYGLTGAEAQAKARADRSRR
jgi:hypothetical protein